MRRTRGAAVVLTAVLGAVCFGGTGVAHAQEAALPLPIDVVVRLDPSAPRPGDLISGIRTVEGFAEAPEGISRIDLYVVRQSLTNQPTDSPPVASMRPSAPLGRANFSLTWNSAKSPQGVVDIVVVARSTASRTAEVRVLGLRVKQQAAAPAPGRSTTKSVSTPAAKPADSAAPTTVRPPALPAAKVVRTPAVPARVQSAQAQQASAFYAAFSGATLGADEPAAVAPAAKVPAVLRPTTTQGRTLWLSVATGMVLLLVAAHTQRAARVRVRFA